MIPFIYLIIPFILIIAITIKWDWIKKLFTFKNTSQKVTSPTVPLENIKIGDIKMDLMNDMKQIENKDEVFAINDNGNFDLMDMNGKILNIGFGPNPKVYINLLDQSEKDTDKNETDGISFISKVGDTKKYEIGGRPYTVNFTRLK